MTEEASRGATFQTLRKNTFTLQYRPVPSLIRRVELRYEKSDKKVFFYGNGVVNNQEPLSFQVVYLFCIPEAGGRCVRTSMQPRTDRVV